MRAAVVRLISLYQSGGYQSAASAMLNRNPVAEFGIFGRMLRLNSVPLQRDVVFHRAEIESQISATLGGLLLALHGGLVHETWFEKTVIDNECPRLARRGQARRCFAATLRRNWFPSSKNQSTFEDGGMIETLIFLVRQWFSRVWRPVVSAAGRMRFVASGRAKICGRWIAPHRSSLGMCHRLLSCTPGQLVWMCNTRSYSSWQSPPQAYASWHPARHTWRCSGLAEVPRWHLVPRFTWAPC